MRRRAMFTVLIVTGVVAALGPVAAAETVGTPRASGPLTATTTFAAQGYATNAGAGRMTAAETMAYWTPERIAAATPARAPVRTSAAGPAIRATKQAEPMLTEPKPPSAEALAIAAGIQGSGKNVMAAATITAGRVYYIDPVDRKEHFCSGATVNSVKRRLVVTAGHCVVNGFWMEGFIFAPGYDNGAPYGFWPALGLAARTDWVYSALPAADVGVAIMAANTSGQLIVDVVGGNGLAWNWPAMSRVDVFSYPNAQQTQLACAGPNISGVNPGTIGMTPCPNARAKGASGGPMVIYYGSLGPGAGYVNSVIADYFTPLPDEIFGPYFEDVNAGLFYYAESVSP